MERIELLLNETQELSFDVDISGITTEKVDVKFVIESDGMDLSFNASLDNGVVLVSLPILSKLLETKTYQAKMGFLVEGTRYFEPMHLMVDLIQPVSITASVNESAKTVSKKKEKVVSEDISFGEITVKKTKSIMERVEDSLENMMNANDIDALLNVYKKDVLLKENSDITAKEALKFINAYCKDKHGKTFNKYVKDHKK